MSKLDDIDYLISLVYDHLYAKMPSRPIESKPLSTNYIKDLTIVKKMYEGKQLDELINIIFNTNISYNGKSESAYIFKRVDQKSDILIRQYPKDQEMNPSTPINVDKIIAYLLSDLVVHKKTLGIMINICNADIPMKELQMFTKKYSEIKLDGVASVTVREHFYKLVTLKEYLKKENSLKNYKNCIFQVLHALDVIQSMYPTFRHNNLTINNVMVYMTNDKTLKFKVSGKEFTFESTGEIKLTNFLKSNMKDYITNDSLEPEMQEANVYYDVNMFLESLLELELPTEISQFIKNVHKKEMSVRDILISSSIFKTSENPETQLGGKYKKDIIANLSAKDIIHIRRILNKGSRSSSKSSSRNSSRNSSHKKNKKTKKYNMSQDEVDSILNIETPVEETLRSLENNTTEESLVTNKHTNNLVDNMMNDLKSKPYVTDYNVQNIANKMPQKPITIPQLGLEFKQPETAEPILEVNLPKPIVETSALSSLLGTNDQPSRGIANGFGVNPASTNFNLNSGSLAKANLSGDNSDRSIMANLRAQKQEPESHIPLNVIPNPYKKNNNGGLGGLFGESVQNGGKVKFNLKGGSERIIPMYKNNRNSPYESNGEKEIKRERYLDAHPDVAREEKEKAKSRENEDGSSKYEEKQINRGFPESKAAFSINIAPELLPPKQRPLPPAPPENVVKMMNYIIPNSFGQQSYSLPNQFAQPSANVMSQNTYNISFANPSQVREFREDILPSKDDSMLKYSMNTISERVIIYQYIRSILIRQSDGENINFLTDKSPEVRNLLSYLRILDVEISKFDKVKNNPLGNLPRRLIIYRSCYPIRVDRANYNVGCAKNNIGINIRIYQMILGETYVNKYRTLPYKVFEVWREIAVYEQMRDNIVKSNMSPNFTMLYAYYITQDTEIDFLKINRLRNRDIIHKREKEQKFVLNDMYKKEMTEHLVGLQKYSTTDLTKLVEQLDIHKPSSKCLIALTEAGTQDLISWGSRQYEDNGLAKKMINTGFHSNEIWLSVLFQMYQSFMCMFKHGISFQNFDVNSNVLIKSLKQDETTRGYWKYRINGIDFYIPNYGYMVMINLDFADIIENDEQTLRNQIENPGRVGLPAHVLGMGVGPVNPAVRIAALDDTSTRRLDKACVYKVYSDELLVYKTDVNMAKNRLRVLDNMKDAFNSNKFNKEFTLNGGIRPDDSIMRTINEINIVVNGINNTEKPKIEAAELAEAAAITGGLRDDDAISRVAGASAQVVVPGVAPAVPVAAGAARLVIEQAEKTAQDVYDAAVAAAIAAAGPAPAARNPAHVPNFDNVIPQVTVNATPLLETLVLKFKEFLHNRVGSSLKESEQTNLIQSDDIEVGELVACTNNNRWGIVINITRNQAGDTYRVITCEQPAGNDNNILSKLKMGNYNNGDLMRTTILVEQVSKPNQQLSDNNLLETYELNF